MTKKVKLGIIESGLAVKICVTALRGIGMGVMGCQNTPSAEVYCKTCSSEYSKRLLPVAF